MPSIHDAYVQELLTPVVDGVEKGPTMMSVLMMLKTKRIAPRDLPTSSTHDTTDCLICQCPLDSDSSEELLILTCGHIFHRSCVETWLCEEKQWVNPVHESLIDVLDEGGDNEVQYNYDECDRFCPTCKHVILPKEGYDWRGYQKGIAGEEAELMLRYFADPQHGEQRMKRLNDNATIGVELTAAHNFAKYHYTKADENAYFRLAELRAAQHDALDLDYVPRKRKRHMRTRRHREHPNESIRQDTEAHDTESHQAPPPIYIDLTQDSDEDEEMVDAPVHGARGGHIFDPNEDLDGENFLKHHKKMRVSEYLKIRREKPQLRRIIEDL